MTFRPLPPVSTNTVGSAVHFGVSGCSLSFVLINSYLLNIDLFSLLNLRQEREVSLCRSCRSCRFQRQTLKEGEKGIPILKGETVSRGMQGQQV